MKKVSFNIINNKLIKYEPDPLGYHNYMVDLPPLNLYDLNLLLLQIESVEEKIEILDNVYNIKRNMLINRERKNRLIIIKEFELKKNKYNCLLNEINNLKNEIGDIYSKGFNIKISLLNPILTNYTYEDLQNQLIIYKTYLLMYKSKYNIN